MWFYALYSAGTSCVSNVKPAPSTGLKMTKIVCMAVFLFVTSPICFDPVRLRPMTSQGKQCYQVLVTIRRLPQSFCTLPLPPTILPWFCTGPSSKFFKSPRRNTIISMYLFVTVSDGKSVYGLVPKVKNQSPTRIRYHLGSRSSGLSVEQFPQKRDRCGCDFNYNGQHGPTVQHGELYSISCNNV